MACGGDGGPGALTAAGGRDDAYDEAGDHNDREGMPMRARVSDAIDRIAGRAAPSRGALPGCRVRATNDHRCTPGGR